MNVSEKLGLESTKNEVSRRDFLGLAATWSSITAFFLAGIALLKFPKPALLPDMSNVFKIGRPEQFPLGTEKVLEDRKVLIGRGKEGIYAVSLICTHLGCIVSRSREGFSCPCHGSVFDDQGRVRQGPAPKPLIWLEVALHPSGKLLVDTKKEVPIGTTFLI